MNKSLILVLAMCLVTVHAFVKRDAPQENNAAFESAKKQAEELFEQIKKSFDPEAMKKSISDVFENASKTFKSLHTEEAPKA